MKIERSLRLALPEITGWRILDVFRNALLPTRCAGCSCWIPAVDPPRAFLQRIGPGAAGDGKSADAGQSQDAAETSLQDTGLLRLEAMLCGSCRKHLVLAEPPLCTVCGRMFKGRQGPDHRCGDCIRQPKQFTSARSAVLYTPGFREVVHRYKYRGKIQLAGPLGEILLAAFLRFWASGDMDVILPVPLHPKRFRQRGFNQAYLLMQHWKHFESSLAATSRVLVKTRATAPQTGLGKAQRRRNIRNAFAVLRPEAVRSRRILLVDDVYTTGATVNECARVLLKSGAEQVNVLTVARAV